MKITNNRFSIRFINVAEHYGFTSIGKFKFFLKSINPNSKLFGNAGTYAGRASRFIEELDQFESNR